MLDTSEVLIIVNISISVVHALVALIGAFRGSKCMRVSSSGSIVEVSLDSKERRSSQVA